MQVPGPTNATYYYSWTNQSEPKRICTVTMGLIRVPAAISLFILVSPQYFPDIRSKSHALKS